jgi:hypothetical protein
MDRTGEHRITQNQPDSEGKLFHIFSHMQILDLKKDTKIKGGLPEGREAYGGGTGTGEGNGGNMIPVYLIHV